MINSAAKELEFHYWINGISNNEFNEYQKMHALAAGRKTRASKTFDLMKEWIESGYGLLVGGRVGEKWAGFILFIIYKNSAYYASALPFGNTREDIVVVGSEWSETQ